MRTTDDRTPRRAEATATAALLARAGVVARSLLAEGPLLARRRLLRDGTVLLTSILVTAVVFFLAVATPQFISRTADRGAREAVSAGGSRADVTIAVPVAPPLPSQVTRAVDPGDIEGVAGGLRALLPGPLAEVYSSTTTTVLSPATDVEAAAPAGQPAYRVRFGLLTEAAAAALVLQSGALPATGPDSPAPLDAVISAAGAATAGLQPGDLFSLTGNPPPPARTGPQPASPTVAVRIAAIADPRPGGDASLFSDEPTFAAPVASASAATPAEVTVLLGAAGLTSLGRDTPVTFDALLRIRLEPARFTAQLMGEVNDASRRLKANNTTLVNGSGYPFVVNTAFADLAEPYAEQAHAANAQMVLVLTGLVGVGICTMLLLGHLLALGRRSQLVLERARGSSFTAIGIRSIAESALVTLVAALLGVGCAAALLPGENRALLPVVLVALTALLLTPAQTLALAGGLRLARPAPRDRAGRRARVRLGLLRRVVLEVAVLVAAVAAVSSLRARGVASGPAGAGSVTDVDPLLAATPLLFALAVSALVLRLVPVVVAVLTRASRRSPGALGVLGAASAGRALRGVTLLPLLALTVGIGLAASGGFFTTSIADGQRVAALQRVGADVRVDGPVTEADLQRVLAAPGVTAAARAGLAPGSALNLGTTTVTVTVVAVDSRYAGLIAAQAGDADAAGVAGGALEGLQRAAAEPEHAPDGEDAPLVAVVDPRVAARLVSNNVVVSIDQQNIRVRVIGTAPAPSPGIGTAASIYVDLDQLTSRLGQPVADGVLLVDGPGASSAVDALEGAALDIHTRAGWLADQQALPLVQGTQTLFAASTLAFALLALVALIATALAGTRTRARDVSLLRTMGFGTRVGWWLAASELLPVVAGSIAGGIGTGAAMVLLLGPAFELASLTGGLGSPVLVLPAAVPLALAGAAIGMLGLAVLAEVLFQRRHRMIDVLRVGETV